MLPPIAMLLLLHWAEVGPAPNPKWQINHARILLNYDKRPPVERAAWESVALPVHRPVSGANYASAWFRLQPMIDEIPEDSWGLYVPVVLGNIEVFVNGKLVGSGGRVEPPLADHIAPLYFEFSSQLLLAGRNRVDVHFVRPHPSVALEPVYFGPASDLVATARAAKLFRFWVPLGLMIGMAVVTLIVGCLALLRRQEPVYAWYAAAIFFWTLHHSHALVTQIPIDYWIWLSFSHMTLGLFVYCAYVFVNRFTGVAARRLEAALGWWMMIGSLALAAVAVVDGLNVVYLSRSIWIPSILIIGLLLVVALIRGVLAVPSAERIALLCVSNLVLIVGIRDYLWEQFGDITESTYYLSYTAAIVLVVFSLILMQRFARALNESELLNQELEGRVREKHRELEGNYSKLRQIEAENVVAKERARIMRDVHDGLGGHLLQLLSRAEFEPALRPLESDIRAALQDLRLIVDSLATTDGDLLSVLATFRHRTQNLIKRNGLQFDWQVTDLPQWPGLGPEQVLNVLRIFQEAVANIIHHAKATTITVATRLENDEVVLSIADNGAGFDDNGRTGHGLANIRRRARDLGGSVDIQSGSNGTRLDLRLPVDKT